MGGRLALSVSSSPMGQNMLTDGCVSPLLTLAEDPRQQISDVAECVALAC